MLLARLRVSWWRKSPCGQTPCFAPEGSSGLQSCPWGRPWCRAEPTALTFSRPNSQAKSSGVFFALLMRHGLDWCWSSISDCTGSNTVQGAQQPPAASLPPGTAGLAPSQYPREPQGESVGGSGLSLTTS